MRTEVFTSNSPEETGNIGKNLAESVKAGTVICLNGDLGVGKTVFTKGFAKGLGITEPVVSPTFTIMQSYTEGKMPLYHFDVYRIDDPSEMDEIGYEDCFFGQGVSLVEWSERILELIPASHIEINIKKDLTQGFDYRSIEVVYTDD